MMIGGLRHVAWDDPTEAIPAFLTLILMPLAVSITEGVAFGVLSYVAAEARHRARPRGASAALRVRASCSSAAYIFLRLRNVMIESYASPDGTYGEFDMDEQTYKDALLKKRSEILGTGGIKPLQASMENNTRQGDMADQASGNNEVHIQLKLKQTDAKILQAIEEALVADRQGHLRRLPRLRRADCASAAERHSVDARLHHLQGKAELVTDLLPLLQEFYREKLAMLLRHQAGARLVGQYDVNNTYQYIINREETQLSWLDEGDSRTRRER